MVIVLLFARGRHVDNLTLLCWANYMLGFVMHFLFYFKKVCFVCAEQPGYYVRYL